MARTRARVYEKAVTKSDKTDAILVIDGKKLHVNKAVLSYHSDYFNTLFNSESQEKSMEEIEIKDVDFDGFATLLSLLHRNPMKIQDYQMEELLKIADRFELPAAKRHLELYLKRSDMDNVGRTKLADKYQLDELLNYELAQYKKRNGVRYYKQKGNGVNYNLLDSLSKETTNRLFHKLLEVDGNIEKKTVETPPMSIYESTFAKSDKTDVILVVDGQKLHVNKAVLSYHSDYFNKLFKENSIEEIEVKDVDFQDFATLLSFFHLYLIEPNKFNAEEVLELSERFLFPSVKLHMESFITTLDIDNFEKIRIGEKYKLERLLQRGIDNMMNYQFKNITEKTVYKELSTKTQKKLFCRYLQI